MVSFALAVAEIKRGGDCAFYDAFAHAIDVLLNNLFVPKFTDCRVK
jgi:hypothetical protein